MEGRAIIQNRLWIRWHPTEPSESTDSVVLRSAPGLTQYFIDVRTLLKYEELAEKPADTSTPGIPAVSVEQSGLEIADSFNSHRATGRIQLDTSWKRLDWAFAGTCEQNGNKLRRRRWVDSKVVDAEEVYDVIDVRPYKDADTGEDMGDMFQLAKGHMSNTKTGYIREFEELWATVPVNESDVNREHTCVVLKTAESNTRNKGMIIRVGHVCQGILRYGRGRFDLIVERWIWEDRDGVWKRVTKIGKGKLPCHLALEASRMRNGTKHEVNGLAWQVVATSYR